MGKKFLNFSKKKIMKLLVISGAILSSIFAKECIRNPQDSRYDADADCLKWDFRECIRDKNDSRYDPRAQCLNFAGRRRDGRCITHSNDTRYNPNDPCLNDPNPEKVPIQGTYRVQRREKFKNLGDGEEDPNDSRYNGPIQGDFIREENDSRFNYTDPRHQD